ncbi:MAG: hypothetical protein RJA44_1789 [Pseudomonadota bacterium]
MTPLLHAAGALTLLALLALPTRAAAEDTQPGRIFRDCTEAYCPEMVWLPRGSFMMGSLPADPDQSRGENPRHRVRINYPLAVGRFEVTFEQFDACVADGGCTHRPADEKWGRDQRPVININWHDAQQFVAWLSGKTGQRYRLLSEAEWEYSARAGQNAKYGAVDQIEQLAEHANWDGSKQRRTIAVGQLKANAWGLHDMIGNSREWVEDCHHDDYRGAPSNGSAWLGGDCTRRLMRGGSWYDYALQQRASQRVDFQAGFRAFNFGLRVARTPS